LAPTPLVDLPVGAVTPGGWVRKQLELQAAGFHGHLGEISPYLKKQGNAWLDPEGNGDHGWEEPPYWLKGYSLVGYLLNDADMLKETQVWIEGAIRSQKPDGWFGPDRGRAGIATGLKGRDDLWPNMIMLFCLESYYDHSHDERVINLMRRYFQYLATVPDDKFLVGYWPKMRGGDLLYSVYWLYNRTGDKSLLELAQKVHRHTADWAGGVINWHNVNMSQAFGEATTFYMQSKAQGDLHASYRNYQTIHDLYGQVPGGMFGGDENCRPGFTGPRQAIETCGMVEMMLSDETLVQITGDLVWADRCEDVTFNSLPAALTADFKALRYLTAPNLVLSDRQSKSPGVQNGGPMFAMDPWDHRCCQHNFGHGWPYYVTHLWYATPDDGLAAVFYSECSVAAKVGDGHEVTVEQTTHYPFDEHVAFTVKTAAPVAFPLYLRVPDWCDKAAVQVNGKAVDVDAKPGRFIRIQRQWKDGDTVTLTLPMTVRLRTWAKNHAGVSVDRGPLTYSLKIGEKYVRSGGTDRWPAWEIHPTTPWNYGLVLEGGGKGDAAAESFDVVKRPWPANNMPFTHEGAPVELVAKGRRIPNWQMDDVGLVGELHDSPVKSDQPTEQVTLIPMGAARLRISAFPVIGDGPDAHDWPAPPKPLPYKPTASHTWGGDTVKALSDGREPKSSNDHSIPRHTWWDHRGTAEWVQYDFDAPREVTGVEVYWFDDTGVGQCRVPASWRLLYRQNGKWLPVDQPTAYGVEKDKFNRTTFTPVKTDGLRIEVQLRDNVSGGVLEWRVLPPADEAGKAK
jgi:Beta-L-arabinofuranosidase, GH127 catalytic domain/Beta-L-arabinofuranosidase, GH127 middle domain